MAWNAARSDDQIASSGKKKHPFRNRFHHCVRVAILAAEIPEREGTKESILVYMRTRTGRSLMLERLCREQRFIQELTDELRIAEFERIIGAIGI